MADKKISELTSITGADVDDTNDTIAIVDSSAGQTKKITREELFKDVDGATFTGNLTLTNPRLGTLKVKRGSDGREWGIGTVGDSTAMSVYDVDNDAVVARFDEAGTSSPYNVTVITREKGDARYAQLSGATFDGAVTLSASQNYVGNSSSSTLNFMRTGGPSFLDSAKTGDDLFRFRGGDETTVARVDDAGTAANNTSTLMTREKGDARYTQISSDERLKENISEMEDVGGLIDNLRPVRFNWKESEDDPKAEGLMYGLIAQEVSKVVPEIALGSEETTMGIDSLSMISVLVKEVQELRKRVAEIENA